jgi:hypothetical protein
MAPHGNRKRPQHVENRPRSDLDINAQKLLSISAALFSR